MPKYRMSKMHSIPQLLTANCQLLTANCRYFSLHTHIYPDYYVYVNDPNQNFMKKILFVMSLLYLLVFAAMLSCSRSHNHDTAITHHPANTELCSSANGNIITPTAN